MLKMYMKKEKPIISSYSFILQYYSKHRKIFVLLGKQKTLLCIYTKIHDSDTEYFSSGFGHFKFDCPDPNRLRFHGQDPRFSKFYDSDPL